MNLIVSVSSNWAIGYKNNLLFHISEDMKYFKSMTVGKVVVMGENTFLSLPRQKPLPDRVNIILSDNASFFVDGAVVVRSLRELSAALAAYNFDDVFIIGGAMLYETMLPHCKNAYVTQFYAVKDADRFFPRLDQNSEWTLVERSDARESNGVKFTFDKYVHDKNKIKSF